ncbi:MAG: orotate phosphoribosyltransferase [Candidatus Hodarchaeota archaeon]
MSQHLEELKKSIMSEIYQNRMFLTSYRDRDEGWTLASGLWSPFYIQLRILSSFPPTLAKVARAMSILLQEQAPNVNKVVGVAFAGIPIATALSLESGLPACHTRKIVGVRTQDDLAKAISEYGQHSLIEGVIEDGDAICIIDDLVTGMGSKLIARDQIIAEVGRQGLTDITCDDVAVVIDRQQGASEKARELGIRLHSLIRLVDEGLLLIRDQMEPEEFQIVSEYLSKK